MHASAFGLGALCTATLLAGAPLFSSQSVATGTARLESAISTLERGRYAQAAVLLDEIRAGADNTSPPNLEALAARTAFEAIDTHLRGGDPEWNARVQDQLDRLLEGIEDHTIADDDDRLRTLEVISSVSLLAATRHARAIADRWPELAGTMRDRPEEELQVHRLRAEAAGLIAAGGNSGARARLIEALQAQERTQGKDTASLVKTLGELAAVADSAGSARRYLEQAVTVAHAEPAPSVDSVAALARLISMLADRQEPLPPSLAQESVTYRDRALDLTPATRERSAYRRSLEAFSTSVEIYALKDMALRGTMLMGVRPTLQHGESLLNLTIAIGALGGPESPFVESWLRELAKYLRFFARYDDARLLESRANAIASR